VLLGKTNMHEIALGVTNVNPHYGPARNPWIWSASRRFLGGRQLRCSRYVMTSLGSIRAARSASRFSVRRGRPSSPPSGASACARHPAQLNLDHAGPMARCVRDSPSCWMPSPATIRMTRFS